MLSVSLPRSPKTERQVDISSFLVDGNDKLSDDFSAGNFLDDINLDDFFIQIDGGDDLPDLEVDPDILAEFSSVESEVNASPSSSTTVEKDEGKREEEEKPLKEPIEVEDRREGSAVTTNSAASDVSRGRKPAAKAKAKESQGKRKVKVDWTPDLHRRFVQAVEQLGVDKAVPSRILELMGIDCLTRHNIASHLQKYRSHRKHMLARETEAANWSQRRQMYGGCSKPDAQPWVATTMGFPPAAAVQPFRPLHVWGHPTVDQSMIQVWPKHIVHSSPPLHPPWSSPPQPTPYWHPPMQQQGSKGAWIPSFPIQGSPCFAQPFTTPIPMQRPVPGIPPHAMNKTGAIPGGGPSDLNLQFDLHPSKETVDAAIEDALAKPWLPLPLGLKPPSVDGVLMELQCQGITKVPPSCA